MKLLHYKVSINAPKEKVWATMLEAETYKEWTKEFDPGSYYEGTWDKDSKIKFLNSEGQGMVSEIAENKKNEFLSIKHLGEIKNGVEDTESVEVKLWAPAYENYTFKEHYGITNLNIDLESNEDWEEFMDEAWPKALNKLKQLCESM